MYLSITASELFDASQGFGIGQATAFTFFVGTMAMMAASAFFFFEIRNVGEKWRTSVLVSGIITFIAAVHYYYMRDWFLKYRNISNILPLCGLVVDGSINVR